ncbi:MAG: hypothetical protein OEZ02_06445, partial [Anaerolineae bacterium]|nr:hypothetical protein [Anaerolineae bacterium]
MMPITPHLPHHIYLISGPRRFVNQLMHARIIEQALQGPVRVLLGGNRFAIYDIAYSLAAQTNRYQEILEDHIMLSRAETCYQVLELLMEAEASPAPTLVADLLGSFYDESVSEREADELLFASILELRRMSRAAAVVVSASPGQGRPRLLKA